MYESFLPSSSIVNTMSTPNIANPKLPELRNLLTVHLAVHLQSLRLPIPFLSIPFVEVLTPYELSAHETHPLTKHNPKHYTPRLTPTQNLDLCTRLKLVFHNRFDGTFLTLLSQKNPLPILGPLPSKGCPLPSMKKILKHVHSTVFDEHPPIVSRIYQVLSDGELHLQNARRIGSTPFPFAYAQLLSFLLLIFTLTFGLFLEQTIVNPWIARVVTVVTVWTYLSFNEVARELEEVWGAGGGNTARDQYEFCKRLEGE
ncbi:hypothetical protein TrVE_jg9911 [Triparma verrucosa]|uniref:Uncharacterized protein n=1 Tax=Triparma verrucosa TaxID=1606542 RepID=A0A9W7CHA9_9STRA|nr:hypothetical protein TrVE_jg9911 [Triparma verrucosa]